jgi:cell division cycle 20-like protein 1 (cofactor of APC complex)
VSKVQGKKKNLWKSSSILRYRKRLSKQSSMINDENDAFQMQRLGGFGKLLRGNQNEFDIKLQQAGTSSVRNITKQPFKVLDAPQLQDDFYLNLVDWSCNNVLAVGLNDSVYIWSAHTSQVKLLCEVSEDDSITSVSWSEQGTHLAVGTHSGHTQIWDTTTLKCVRTFSGHLARVSSIAWNKSIVSTGSKDRNILQRDLRA